MCMHTYLYLNIYVCINIYLYIYTYICNMIWTGVHDGVIYMHHTSCLFVSATLPSSLSTLGQIVLLEIAS